MSIDMTWIEYNWNLIAQQIQQLQWSGLFLPCKDVNIISYDFPFTISSSFLKPTVTFLEFC